MSPLNALFQTVTGLKTQRVADVQTKLASAKDRDQNEKDMLQLAGANWKKGLRIAANDPEGAQEFFNNAISLSALNKLKHVRCLDSLQISTQNPVNVERQLQGDLFYLTVRTLDSAGAELGITCTVNGFFHNQSSASTFNPLPSKTNPCFSYTLVGCLH